MDGITNDLGLFPQMQIVLPIRGVCRNINLPNYQFKTPVTVSNVFGRFLIYLQYITPTSNIFELNIRILQ